MQNQSNQISAGQARPQSRFSPSGALPVICSGIAVAILAFSILFALVTNCSLANITFFVTMFIVSGILSIAGAFMLVLSRIKPGNRYTILNVLLLILYIALLLFLRQLMYS